MKHLKKDDGYVLVYVLIVFTILSLVAGSICTMALNNLKAQKADAARMQARYAAEGYLQQFVAQVEDLETIWPDEATPATEDAGETAKTEAKSKFWNTVETFGVEDSLVVDSLEEVVDGVSDKQKLEITAKATAAGYKATIIATAEVTVTSAFDDATSRARCTMDSNGWKYTSYDISYEEVPQ